MRVVIKIGTNVLIDASGLLNEARFLQLCQNIAEAKDQGYEIALVASGAVGVGKTLFANLDLHAQRKVLAAIGQPALMQKYLQYFRLQNVNVGQCLLSRYDFADRELYNNLVEIFEDFFRAGVVPIINENDVFAPQSLNFGDNDSLAAMLAIAIKADLLLLLTNQPGLLSGDPRENHKAELITVVTRVDKEIERMCSKTTSVLGQGGMISKVKAARQAVYAGITAFVADGREPEIVKKILNGQLVGTRFIACADKEISNQKRWLMAAKGFGQVLVDEGAAKALRAGKSLLFPGVVAIKGLFEPGSIVEVISGGEIVSYGKINYSDKELGAALAEKKKLAAGAKSLEKEIIHRDYMIVLENL